MSTGHPSNIGRYEVVERLAIGGMAEVYLACDRGPHGVSRVVVIKRILPHLAENQAMIRMFLHEARVATRIQHPNVVQIIDVGEDHGQPYIVMEYVLGSTLREVTNEARRQERGLPAQVALYWMIQACSGAHAAHELSDGQGRPAGLVHRDLTPHNLIVDNQAHVKLLDFGIAKGQDDGDFTRTGVLKGKLRYMSPEQAEQRPLDRRSDIFTLGIVTWELLAGTRMFDRPTELATMQAIVTGDVPSLGDLRPDLPKALIQAVNKSLAVDREDRYPTAEAMRWAIAEAAREAGLITTAEPAITWIHAILGARHRAKRTQIEAILSHAPMPNRASSTPRPAPTSTGTSFTGTRALGWIGAAGVAGLFLLAASTVVVGGSLALWWRMQDQPPAGVSSRSGVPIRWVLAPVYDPAVMLYEYEPLRKHLESRLDRPVQMEVAASYAEAGEMLADGRADFAMLPPIAYLTSHQKHPDLKLVAMKVFDDSTGSDGVILVRGTSGVGEEQPLNGLTICYSDVSSSTGYILPRAWLRKQGFDPDKDLKGRVSGNHFQALRDLSNGACDVAGTYSGAWIGADRAGISASRLRVLAITGRTPNDTVVTGAKTPQDLVDPVVSTLFALDPQRDLGIARIGQTERITGFTPPDLTAFEELEAALKSETAASDK